MASQVVAAHLHQPVLVAEVLEAQLKRIAQHHLRFRVIELMQGQPQPVEGIRSLQSQLGFPCQRLRRVADQPGKRLAALVRRRRRLAPLPLDPRQPHQTARQQPIRTIPRADPRPLHPCRKRLNGRAIGPHGRTQAAQSQQRQARRRFPQSSCRTQGQGLQQGKAAPAPFAAAGLQHLAHPRQPGLLRFLQLLPTEGVLVLAGLSRQQVVQQWMQPHHLVQGPLDQMLLLQPQPGLPPVVRVKT